MAAEQRLGGLLMGFFDLFKGPKVKRIGPAEARALVDSGAQFIDVRHRQEFRSGHAIGAKNIALGMLPNQIKHLDSNRPIVCICQSGMRSGRAAQLLTKHGFEEVYNVGGGSTAWHAAGMPWE
jgi:rhodanese-related sulfurtransferase